jgi:hypothetical protein
MNHDSTSADAPARTNPGAAALWASAFVIAALVITQAGRLSSGNAAYADVATSDDLTVSTIFAGVDDDVVAVIDRQTERLYVYGVEQASRVELLQSHDLKELFTQGRGTVPATTVR